MSVIPRLYSRYHYQGPRHKFFQLSAMAVAAYVRPGPTDLDAETDYSQDMSEHLWASTDMLIIVEGVGLACHKQVMAVNSKVFAGMADMVSSHGHGAHDDSILSPQAHVWPECLRVSAIYSINALILADAPLHLKEPFKGKKLADMRLLMFAIYRCITVWRFHVCRWLRS